MSKPTVASLSAQVEQLMVLVANQQGELHDLRAQMAVHREQTFPRIVAGLQQLKTIVNHPRH